MVSSANGGWNESDLLTVLQWKPALPLPFKLCKTLLTDLRSYVCVPQFSIESSSYFFFFLNPYSCSTWHKPGNVSDSSFYRWNSWRGQSSLFPHSLYQSLSSTPQPPPHSSTDPFIYHKHFIIHPLGLLSIIHSMELFCGD